MIFNLGLKAMILLKIYLLLLSIPVITKKFQGVGKEYINMVPKFLVGNLSFLI